MFVCSAVDSDITGSSVDDVGLVSLREHLFFLKFYIRDAGNTPLVGDGTLFGRDHSRYTRECWLRTLAVLHLGVLVMWHSHIRDLSPTAEAVRELLIRG